MTEAMIEFVCKFSFSYFNRDVECISTFFRRRFNYESKLYPRFKSTMKDGAAEEGDGFRLDVVVAASGFKKGDQKVLEEVCYCGYHSNA